MGVNFCGFRTFVAQLNENYIPVSMDSFFERYFR